MSLRQLSTETRRWWRRSSHPAERTGGQTLRLGGRTFRIAAGLVQEPDRFSAGPGMGPRVMISQAALARTGLIAPGSRASQRMLVKLPDNGSPGLSGKAALRSTRWRCGRNWKTRCRMRR